MRVLVTGAGGELGFRVASRLAADPRVTHLAGMDLTLPRRRLKQMAFTVVDPVDRRKVLPAVRRWQPDAIVHLGVYEPDARSTPALARERTSSNTVAVLGAAAGLGGLRRVVVRSGLEVYGRRRSGPSVPGEDVPPDPTTPFGASLLEVERLAVATGRECDVPVAALRLAPVLGPGFPSPLGRLLRLPAVPFSVLADPPFSVLHVDDAAAVIVAALFDDADGPVNVVAPGAVTMSQAALLGGRLPVPVVGPEWSVLTRLAGLARVPVPRHLTELVHRGRTADGSLARDLLGVAPSRSTKDVVRELFSWREPSALRPAAEEAA